MYTTVLTLHSWVRWLALVAAVGATFAAVRGKVQGTDSLADRWGLVAMMALDIQMLLGLLLYFVVSPNMRQILRPLRRGDEEPGSSASGRSSTSRRCSSRSCWCTSAACSRARRATPAAKRTRLLVCFGLATVLMMVGTPWPGRPGGRPLFRL